MSNWTKSNDERSRRRCDDDHHVKRNKRLKSNTTISPWRDQWELKHVGMRLSSFVVNATNPPAVVSDGSMSNLEALESVAVWRSRSSSERLPHAIEATAALAQVIWFDSMSSSSSCSLSLLRLSYSSAIVRCINGFADVLQQQRFTAGSVSMLCGQLGIPSWLVDIRHEASHNSLPSLEVLRLAATTLMDFLQKEYWIPTCGCWSTEGGDSGGDVRHEADVAEDISKRREKKAMELLQEYKTTATASQLERTRRLDELASQQNIRTIKKRKVMTLPADDDENAQSTDSSYSNSTSDDFDEFEGVHLGNIWTPALGTNTNRFAALQSAKSKNREKVTAKKQKFQKSHIDYANEYVRHVPIQLGFSVALSFLIWGGMGGAPGRGVLIPGSTVAFPASEYGIKKTRERYSPLILALCRTWPGFGPALLVHIVDFILSLESPFSNESDVDVGTARKLFFLSSWVHFLLSMKFVIQLHPEAVAEWAAEPKFRWSNDNAFTDVVYAHFMVLQKQMHYPLNVLCDRCSLRSGHVRARHHAASLEVFDILVGILGQNRVKNCGIQDCSLLLSNPECAAPETYKLHFNLNTANDSMSGPSHGKMLSLAAMEAMLADGDKKGEEKVDAAFGEKENRQYRPRSTWVRCVSWDACSIGSLPGFPE
jgi:ribosomal biogenesis protein LAS1